MLGNDHRFSIDQVSDKKAPLRGLGVSLLVAEMRNSVGRADGEVNSNAYLFKIGFTRLLKSTCF